MFVSLITLLSALSLSSISAYYSVLGLMAIFSAAPIPVAVMGTSLEIAKIVTTIWLHYNWEKAPLRIKMYLVPAVCTLMLITSLGSFGFLSKGHADQAVPSGDIQAKVLLLDEKIKTQRDNIDASKKALVQLDNAVDQVLSRSTTEAGAAKSVALRKTQAKERTSLQKDIEVAQAEISKLQEERAPVASQLRQAVAEVGPIKYIAAVIYGDNTDDSLLESSVRWVIVIIVAVFDPLAIVLLLAATTSMDWSRLNRKDRRLRKIQEKIEEAEDEAKLAEARDRLKHVTDKKTTILIDTAVANARLQFDKELADKIREVQATASAEVAEATAELRELSELHSNKDQLLTSMTEQSSLLSLQITELTRKLSDMENSVSSAVNREEMLKDELVVLQTEFATLKEKKTALENELDQVAGASEVITELQTNLDKVTSQLRDAEVQIVSLREELEVVRDSKFELQYRLTEQEQLLETANAQLSIQQEEDRAVAEVNKEIAEFISSIEPLDPEFQQVLNTHLEDLYEEDSTDVLSDTTDIVEDIPAVSESDNVEVAEEVKEPEVVIDSPFEPEVVSNNVARSDEIEFIVPVEPALETTVVNKVARIAPDYSHGFDTSIKIPEKAEVTLPEVAALPRGSNAGFGTEFPTVKEKGDMFLRIDFKPSKLFKWTNEKWIIIDKSNIDIYSYDEEYIKLLIAKVSTGEYEVEDLSDLEQEQIAKYLANQSI